VLGDAKTGRVFSHVESGPAKSVGKFVQKLSDRRAVHILSSSRAADQRQLLAGCAKTGRN